MAAFSAYFAC